MKNLKKSFILSLIIVIVAVIFLLLQGCSSIKRSDDAIRIKPGAVAKYVKNPVTSAVRDGRTLRGTVVKVQVVSVPDSCPVTEATPYTRQARVIFLDSMTKNTEGIEYIPLEDVELIGQETGLPVNQYNNINLFETYNNPASLRNIREVPVDSIIKDTCFTCDCQQLGTPSIDIRCPSREFSWYFVELRGGYGVYSDKGVGGLLEGRQAWMGEIALGFRLGGRDEWGLGLAASTGVKAANSFKLTDIQRPIVMLHGRYQSPEDNFLGLCLKPFLYAQFGITVDELSLKLANFSFKSDCQDKLKVVKDNQDSGIDWSTPISWGLGGGFDFPLTSFMSLSFDLGYRSIAFGESADVQGFLNVPSMRRMDMFLFRFGFTF